MNPSHWHDLIARQQSGAISDEELKELEEILRQFPEARTLFHQVCRVDEQLQRKTEALSGETPPGNAKTVSIGPFSASWLNAGLAAAVVILLGILTWSWASQPPIVATIHSSENAAWESPLPTTPGSKLTAGPMNLTSGIATLHFRSGAEMMLEAPVKFTILSPMKARLESGMALLNVPKSAIGFTLETPEGRVVDHGTSFAVNVGESGNPSTVEVLEGEVEVEHLRTGDQLRLYDQQAATLTSNSMAVFEGPFPIDDEVEPEVARIGTGGKSISVIRRFKEKWLHPDKLMVNRRVEPGNHERRAFFSFDLSEIDLDQVATAQLRLNQVPSGIGFASRLPEVVKIAVYGITDPNKTSWPTPAQWEDGPTSEDGVLLGHLQIPRSQQRASRFFQSDALLPFLKAYQNAGSVTFLLDGALDPLTGDRVRSLVIAFASDTNPEASGPLLEFTLKQETTPKNSNN